MEVPYANCDGTTAASNVTVSRCMSDLLPVWPSRPHGGKPVFSLGSVAYLLKMTSCPIPGQLALDSLCDSAVRSNPW